MMHGYSNMSGVSDEATTDFVQHLNQTNYSTVYDWGLEICSLEQQLSNAAEGTGLAFIIFTQAIVELPGT
jgi:solute carrier family 6 amino acid/orphan transporter-like 15/16/17/18/20